MGEALFVQNQSLVHEIILSKKPENVLMIFLSHWSILYSGKDYVQPYT